MTLSPGGRPADASPVGHGGDNWVTRTGGLPTYMRMIVHALIRKGMAVSRAIATAHETLERLAATSKDPKVKAAAAAALLEWNAKRGASKAMTAAKSGINLSAEVPDGHFDIRDLVDLSAVAADDASTIDLAPGDYRPPYDWKHGYVPLTPAAVKSKAGKGPHGRAKPPKGTKVGKTSRAAAATPKRVATKTGPALSSDPDVRGIQERIEARTGTRPTTDQARAALDHAMRTESDKPSPAARLAKAKDDDARGRSTPGETTAAQNAVNASAPRSKAPTAKKATPAEVAAAKPQGKDAREMTPAEKIKAVDIMRGSDSPAAKRARERWGTGTTEESRATSTPGSGATSKQIREKRTAQETSADEAGRRNATLPLDQLRAEQRRMFEEGKAGPTPSDAELLDWQKSLRTRYGIADTSSSSNPDIAARINAKTQAVGFDSSGASSTSKSKGYRDLDGPRLVDEANKRGLGGKETLSKKSDSQLRTMLKDHDRNLSASHEDNAKARATGGFAGRGKVEGDGKTSTGGHHSTPPVVIDRGVTRYRRDGSGTWYAAKPGDKGGTPVTNQRVVKDLDVERSRVIAAHNNATPAPGDQGSTAIGKSRAPYDTAPSTLDATTLRNIPDETLDRNISRYQAAHDRAKATSPATAESPTLRAMKAEKARRDSGDTVTDATRKRRRDKAAADGDARYLEGQRARRDTTPPADLTDTQLSTAYGQQQDRTSARARALKAEQDRRAGKGAPKDPFDLPGINVLSDGAVTGDDSRLQALEKAGMIRPDPTAKPRPWRLTDQGKAAYRKPAADSDRAKQARQVEEARSRGTSAGSSSTGQATVTPAQREQMLDRATRGGQNRADAEKTLDKTLREAGPGTLEARLKYEGFITNAGIPKGTMSGPLKPGESRVTKPAGPDQPAKLTDSDISRMSDDQLDRAFERLSAAGDSAALTKITDEIDRRERRAEGNRPRR